MDWEMKWKLFLHEWRHVGNFSLHKKNVENLQVFHKKLIFMTLTFMMNDDKIASILTYKKRSLTTFHMLFFFVS